ncbi:hypothetical protein OC834_001492 [Tilletia horrida]|nr:hypothetical protein OC834_001492 [Tilletia horrida]
MQTRTLIVLGCLASLLSAALAAHDRRDDNDTEHMDPSNPAYGVEQPSSTAASTTPETQKQTQTPTATDNGAGAMGSCATQCWKQSQKGIVCPLDDGGDDQNSCICQTQTFADQVASCLASTCLSSFDDAMGDVKSKCQDAVGQVTITFPDQPPSSTGAGSTTTATSPGATSSPEPVPMTNPPANTTGTAAPAPGAAVTTNQTQIVTPLPKSKTSGAAPLPLLSASSSYFFPSAVISKVGTASPASMAAGKVVAVLSSIAAYSVAAAVFTVL